MSLLCMIGLESPFRAVAPCVLVGALAVYLVLPRPQGFPKIWGGLAAGLALVLTGWRLIRHEVVSPESLLFYSFSAIAVISGGLMIAQRNPIRSALSFALVILSTCGLFLIQSAPFLMAATAIIYAGAVIVTFTFVIMLAQQLGYSDADARSREPLLSCIAGFVLLGALLYVLQGRGFPSEEPGGLQPPARLTLSPFSQHEIIPGARGRLPAENVAYLGRSLFTDYLLAVELGGTLLLVATIGAIAITSRRPEASR